MLLNLLKLRSATSIREKLNRILLVTTTVALVLAGLVLVGVDLRKEWNDAGRDLVTQAEVVALGSEAALTFADRRVGQETLSALRAKPEVVAAALYDPQGRLFASYVGEEGAQVPQMAPPVGTMFGWRHAYTLRPVVRDREPLGSAYVQIQHELLGRLLEYMAWLVVIMAGSLATALALANRLQRAVVEPIAEVSRVSQTVLREGSYDVRATRTSQDEVGQLVDAFNAMLEELGRRARTLQDANAALRASEERYQLAVRGSSAGLYDWDIGSDVMFISPRFKALLGYSEEEFPNVSTSIIGAMHPEDREPVQQALRDHLSHDKPFAAECRLRDRQGRWVWFLITGLAQRDEKGRAFRMAGSLVDVSERKRAEMVLQEANRAKDEFLATLAHELRNPLAPLRTGVEILKHAGADSAAGKRTLETMERQLTHMVRLIDDLLDISRITSGKIRLNMARISVRQAVETALELSRPGMDAAGHALAVALPDHDIQLQGDMTRIAQAVGNLLNNAAKYTPAGGHIQLRLWQEGSEACIEVADDGIGIPPEMLESIFSLFTQVGRSLEQSHGGLGIGLYLVRRLIALHGGSVSARSGGTGKGSRFTVRLPCLPQALPAPERPSGDALAAGAAVAPAKILVVDDNVDAAETLASLLEMMGLRTRCVHDGLDVQDAALAFAPDIVLLDIGLPGMNGYEVARQLRAHPQLARTTLVALTGWGTEGDRQRAREAGFDHHLTKPVALPELEKLLQPQGSAAA